MSQSSDYFVFVRSETKKKKRKAGNNSILNGCLFYFFRVQMHCVENKFYGVEVPDHYIAVFFMYRIFKRFFVATHLPTATHLPFASRHRYIFYVDDLSYFFKIEASSCTTRTVACSYPVAGWWWAWWCRRTSRRPPCPPPRPGWGGAAAPAASCTRTWRPAPPRVSSCSPYAGTIRPSRCTPSPTRWTRR
jgi:hypothetical protein